MHTIFLHVSALLSRHFQGPDTVVSCVDPEGNVSWISFPEGRSWELG